MKRLTSIDICISICYALALVIPCLLLSNINTYWSFGDTLHFAEDSFLLEAEENLPRYWVRSLSERYDGISVFYTLHGVCATDDGIADFTFSPIDNMYMNYTRPAIVEGRNLNQTDFSDGINACLIKDSLSYTYPFLKLGSTITIEGTELEIVGIFKVVDNSFYPGVLLPCTVIDENDAANVKVTILSKEDIQLDCVSYKSTSLSNRENHLKSMLDRNAVQEFALCLITIGFTILNISSIILARCKREKKKYGIMIALGAWHKEIRRDLLCNNLLLLAVALPMNLVLMIGVFSVAPSSADFYFTPAVFMISAGVGAAICTVLSLLTSYRMLKYKPIDIIRGNLSIGRIRR